MEKSPGKFWKMVRLLGRGKAQRRDAVRRLAEYEDVRAVGPLAEALWVGDAQTREVAATALIRLLPRLQETDANLLNRKQLNCLTSALNGTNPALILAILKSYERIGDDWSLHYVKKLAAGIGKAAQDERIRRAALECLPFLRARVEQENERHKAQTLLRSSSAPSVPAEALRPSPQDKPEAKT